MISNFYTSLLAFFAISLPLALAGRGRYLRLESHLEPEVLAGSEDMSDSLEEEDLRDAHELHADADQDDTEEPKTDDDSEEGDNDDSFLETTLDVDPTPMNATISLLDRSTGSGGDLEGLIPRSGFGAQNDVPPQAKGTVSTSNDAQGYFNDWSKRCPNNNLYDEYHWRFYHLSEADMAGLQAHKVFCNKEAKKNYCQSKGKINAIVKTFNELDRQIQYDLLANMRKPDSFKAKVKNFKKAFRNTFANKYIIPISSKLLCSKTNKNCNFNPYDSESDLGSLVQMTIEEVDGQQSNRMVRELQKDTLSIKVQLGMLINKFKDLYGTTNNFKKQQQYAREILRYGECASELIDDLEDKAHYYK